ncbi:MAG: patatin-like phospholipase family protein [Bacteroides sp.]|nr:patatin-like phospholipase family protein [Bacteroides sp.]
MQTYTNIIRKLGLLLLAFLSVLPALQAQKVGLVLSGGGAKGMTHIGIIRALEENNIPIDYITGTSMGAIIGSLYAMGYSPDDMEALLRSPDFKRWYSGQVEPQYEYYFKKGRPTPEFFNIRFSLRDSLRTNPLRLPTNMISPIQMNLVFVELFACATASCRGNFDNLFVPFRCIASDVYNKRALIMRKGDLGDAVRASMSFPFVFKPIEIDSILAYDGGIYNNFPTDVMREDFRPDIIIGSVVATNPGKPEENDLMSQIENMVTQKTDYSIPDSLGILMTFNYGNVSLLDFDRLQELHDVGYRRTMELMDSIKGRIHRRVSMDNVRLRRMVYRSNLPQLRFRNISIDGANEQQQAYIRKEFHDDENEVFTYEDLKRGYFRLLADNMISEIIPHAVYDPQNDLYELHLKVKMKDSFSVRLGGSVSTTSSNQIYLGLGYQNLNYYSKEFTFDGQLGKIYNNAQLMARIDLPTRIPTSFRFLASFSTFDYYNKNGLFSKNDDPTFNSKNERFLKLMVALPFLANKRAEFSFGMGRLKDYYYQSSIIDFEKDHSDQSLYDLMGGAIGFYGSTLNVRQYATKGYYEKLIAQIFTGKEKFTPGNDEEASAWQERQSWLQISYMKEAYHAMSHKFTLGWQVDAVYASKNFSENYTATLMQACEFSPTPHSKLMYNEAFRANQFVAAGIKPIFVLNDMFQFRTEFYGFLPIFPIKANDSNRAYYGKAFSRFEYMGEVSFVCHLPFGAISAYVNHYSSPSKEWNVGLTIGWQLFNYRFIE